MSTSYASPRKIGKRFLAHVQRLHAQGLSDRQIARRLNRSHGVVTRVRNRLGLASNARVTARGAWQPGFRGRLSEIARNRVRQLGLEEVCVFARRLCEERAQAIRMGWPQAETLLEARVLDVLYRRGPMTRLAICGALGRRCNWTGVVIRSMRNRGLLANRGYAGRWVRYGLAEGVRPTPAKRPRREGGAP